MVNCVREKITLENLISLRNCRKSLEFNDLSLNYKGFETVKFLRKAISSLKRTKEVTREDALRSMKEMFEKEYLKEWFSFQYQYEQTMERDKIRINRIIDYISFKGYTILNTDVEYSIPINATYRDYSINEITGNVDFVFGKDDDVFLVNIHLGENPFSHRARKQDTLEDNSMELLGTAVGLGNNYPGKHVFIESWYLTNKDDKANALAPAFEHKRGKNIARIMFTNSSDMRKKFYTVAAFSEGDAEKCESCIHKNICKPTYELRKDEVNAVSNEQRDAADVWNFTESQKTVNNHMEGSMCVIAGPGSGKTFVLVSRLKTMLKKGIRPEEILFITYTRKAASEIKQRVMALLGTESEKDVPNIFTYNALGYTILKENPMFLGKRVKLADKVDRYVMISDVLKFSPKIKYVSYDVIEEFSLIKKLDEWFEQIGESGEQCFLEENKDKLDVNGILKVYKEYNNLFNERGYINYDMQISLVNELFVKYPSLSFKYAKKFKYIMVDEYQDTSEEQANMIYAIAKKHGNLVVVGDDDQSIYAFRKGSNKFMLNFGKDFPSSKIVIMNDNFRSVNSILASANNIITNNGERYEKALIGHKDASYKPIYLKNYSADKLSGLISEILKKGYRPGDIAILARSHKRLEEVHQNLIGNYKVAEPKELLYEDTVFQTLYDVFTLYYKGLDEDEAFYRFFKVMGVELLEKANKSESLYKNMVSSNRILPIDKMDIHCLPSYEENKDFSESMSAGYKLIKCFKKIQYAKGLNVLSELFAEIFGLTGHTVIDMLTELADERAFVTISQLYNFMTNMRLYKDDRVIEYEPCMDAINLLTCHSAKGKEYPVVIVYATEDFNSEEEEVRLFYVSMTRAKNTLFFVETIYNRCKLLPKLQGSVVIR